jgi:hypothetical protein
MTTSLTQNVPLSFEFTLRPVDEIQPWGSDDEQRLHWFGLTDGCYWIRVGSEEIYRYADGILKDWAKRYPDTDYTVPYVDYQIVRLWEDLLEIIPSVLEPLPPDFAAIAADAGAWVLWETKAEQWKQDGPEADSNDRSKTFYTAVSWWSNRRLSAWHLQHSPYIWFWRVGDTVSFRWDCLSRNEDGIQVWQAQTGELSLSIAEFIESVTTFDQRLIGEMRSRIDAARAGGLRPGVVPDIDSLERDHAYRATCMPAMLKAAPFKDYDWDDVREAMARIDAEMHQSIQVEV